MKILTTLLAGILLTTFLFSTSCEKNDEEKVENWIVGTWNIDRYVQKNYEDGEITGESESLDQGKIEFREDGTGSDIGGNFIGSDFEWENTDTELFLTAGGTTTEYVIESFSSSSFVFSITVTEENSKDVERWYMSK